MRRLQTTLVFLIFLNISQSYTNFIHLLGWTLKASTLKKVTTTNANDCSTECAMNKSCTGFQMLYGKGQCNLLTMVRGYKFEPSQCQYYLKRSANVTFTGRNLTSEIDILLQNAAYDTQDRCPLGWDFYPSLCFGDMDTKTCNEYAKFFEAYFDGFGCNIPLTRVAYSCPDSSFTLGSYTDGHFCTKLIPKWSDDTDIGGMQLFEFANQYCMDQTGGYLASIHSKAENDDITAILKAKETAVYAVMIGMITNSTTVTSVDDMYWMDGTPTTYTNFYGKTTTAVCTLLAPNGIWQTAVDQQMLTRFKYIACKQNAAATLTKTYRPD